MRPAEVGTLEMRPDEDGTVEITSPKIEYPIFFFLSASIFLFSSAYYG
jgi:hypothetical protein